MRVNRGLEVKSEFDWCGRVFILLLDYNTLIY